MNGDIWKSEQMIAKVRSPMETKAHVLNKIVRDASGVHTYALVPPIENELTQSKTSKRSLIDPETNPILKPYRDQINRKPIMTSFGHRPNSASRVFHPATMKIHLKHEEVVHVETNGKNGFGLPTSVLSQLLHCPRLERPSEKTAAAVESEYDAEDRISSPNLPNAFDTRDLFLPDDEMAQLVSHPSTTQFKSNPSRFSRGERARSLPALSSSDRHQGRTLPRTRSRLTAASKTLSEQERAGKDNVRYAQDRYLLV